MADNRFKDADSKTEWERERNRQRDMKETEQLHGAASRFSEMKILIIDDELSNVALLEDLLSDSGYTRVKSILDPRLTLETCNEFEPDVVLLDLRMPHMDGFAVLEALRANDRGA